MHYMICPSEKAKNERYKVLKHTKKVLQAQGIHEAIIRSLINGLTITDGTPTPTTPIGIETTVQHLIHQAINDQTHIGWSNI